MKNKKIKKWLPLILTTLLFSFPAHANENIALPDDLENISQEQGSIEIELTAELEQQKKVSFLNMQR